MAKLTQEQMLEILTEKPFNQKKCVPADATVEYSPPERWWRSDSPDRGEGFPDLPTQTVDSSMSGTRGVLGMGQRSGPVRFFSQYQTGPGTAAHFKDDGGEAPTISGYSGHIAGKYAGNCIGGTYSKGNEDAIEHLKTTSQAQRFPGLA